MKPWRVSQGSLGGDEGNVGAFSANTGMFDYDYLFMFATGCVKKKERVFVCLISVKPINIFLNHFFF